MPRISIVTPLYNGEMFLPYMVASVLRQSFRDFEILLIDDGSKDGSLALAKKLAEKDDRIKVSAQENRGVAATRHCGATELAKATDFLLFLDQDDILNEGALQSLIAAADAHKDCVAVHGFLRIIDGLGVTQPYHHCEVHNWMRRKVVNGEIIPTPIEEPTDFTTLSYLNFIYTPGCVLIRKDAYLKSGGFDQSVAPADDWDLWLKLTLMGPMYALPETVLAWRLHGNNNTFDREKMLAATDAVYERYLERAKTPEQKASITEGYLQFTRDRLKEGQERPEILERLKVKESQLAKNAPATRSTASKRRGARQRKLKILLVLHYMGVTGAPRVILDIFDHLNAMVDLHIVYLEGGLLETRAREVAPSKNLESLTRPATGFKSKIIRSLRKIVWERWMRKFDPDIIYVNTAAALPALGLMNFPKKPLLLHIHEMRMMLERHFKPNKHLFQQWPVRKEIVCVSEACRNDMSLVGNIPSSQINIINACVPLNFAVRVAKHEEERRRQKWQTEKKKALDDITVPQEMEAALAKLREKLADKQSKGKQLVVGGSGVTQWQKGLEPWLLMASRVAKALGPTAVKFLWIGMDHTPDTHEVLEKMRLLGLEDMVEFVPQTLDPFNYYAQFDVFAMTSWEDPCPLVVLEAMLLEKPVVCFKNGMGASEEVGDTGIVIDSGLPSDMAAAVVSLLKDPVRRHELGVAASKRVVTYFTVNKSARELATLLQDMGAA